MLGGETFGYYCQINALVSKNVLDSQQPKGNKFACMPMNLVSSSRSSDRAARLNHVTRLGLTGSVNYIQTKWENE